METLRRCERCGDLSPSLEAVEGGIYFVCEDCQLEALQLIREDAAYESEVRAEWMHGKRLR